MICKYLTARTLWIRCSINMKIILLISIGLLLNGSIWAQKSCECVRTGVFQAKPNEKSETVYVTVERTSSEQVEILSSGDTIRYTLSWLSECKYVLENNEYEEPVRMVVTITKARASYYDYTSTMPGQPIVKGRMYRKKGNL